MTKWSCKKLYKKENNEQIIFLHCKPTMPRVSRRRGYSDYFHYCLGSIVTNSFGPLVLFHVLLDLTCWLDIIFEPLCHLSPHLTLLWEEQYIINMQELMLANRSVTVHLFVVNRFGTGLSVRCTCTKCNLCFRCGTYLKS